MNAYALTAAIQRSQARFLWSTMLALPIRATPPFNGPFNTPPTGPARQEGVYEVNVPIGDGPNATVLFKQNITAVSLPNDGRLFSTAQASNLYGEIPNSSSFQLTDPLGFRPDYFLEPSVTRSDGRVSQGFESTPYCGLEPIHDYEVSEGIGGEGEGESGEARYRVPCSEP